MFVSEPMSPGSVVPVVSTTGIEIPLVSDLDSLALTVTSCPSLTGLGEAERLTVGGGGPSSRMVITTEDGLPTLTLDGRLPSETVNVSSSSSASRVVWIVPVPVVCPPLIVMFVSEPMSLDSADPTVSVTGTDMLFVRAADNLALTVTGCPSLTGLGDAERLTVGGDEPSSRMVTTTEDGLPAVTLDGRLPSETVNVSSSSSASRVVWMVPVPVVCPPLIVMFVSEPMSPASVVPVVSTTGIETLLVSDLDSPALTVTSCPSLTGLGEAERLTVGGGGPSSRIVITTEDGLPTFTLDGRLPSETVNVSSSSSASRVVWIVPVPVVCPPLIVMFVSEPMSPASADPAVSVTGTDTLFVSAADNLALTVTGCPSFTGLGEAERLTVGIGG
jgi:hypothetical protein